MRRLQDTISKRSDLVSEFENMSRIIDRTGDSVAGHVVYTPFKSLFLISMYAASIWGCWAYLSWDTVSLFTVKTVTVLLLGHSVGMHRRLIHKSFDCPKWLERILVYFGVLVGLGGPFAMIRTHDLRDWAQRQARCHDYFAHRQPPLTDAWWQMHCEVKLDQAPRLIIEPDVADDAFYRFIDRHWIAVHLPWVVVFWLIGGLPWVIWGVCTQIAVTVTGHWLIGWFAHQPHHEHWQVRGAGVQGRNVPLTGLLTMGEGWHNNHHAFPGSARIGLYAGQADPGYWLIKGLESAGLVWNIRLPEDLAWRPQLHWADDERPIRLADRKPCHIMTLIGRACGLRA